eukprot:TRINITY_DN64235_c0_g1_i1.p1 TRINITY_DN64235_c0_g1~~TRINITY_DN64235_c0_g1_i1.p1  ORF type:complete len:248 (+),score=51.04 TRINITY_DN64235_c0_g1_i1:66-746(+)
MLPCCCCVGNESIEDSRNAIQSVPIFFDEAGYAEEVLMDQRDCLYEAVKPSGIQDDTFLIDLSSGECGSLGIECTQINESSLRVNVIGHGRIDDWNAARTEGKPIVRIGDTIIEVNGSRVSSTMHEKLQEASVMCVVKPRGELAVFVEKTGNFLGLDVHVKKKFEGLLVTQVFDGPILEWNASNPTKQVQVGDRIVEVNGVRGEVRLLVDKLKHDDKLALKVVSFH